ncbi:DUF4386 domain-containing protein [Nakamurella sp.]|uniref:DUF4386 domain-containing protein n=1 Tax=Nakamurella sp. TaxID=1869182 RepID=UPI00378458B9
MSDRTIRRTTAALLFTAAALAIAGFTALGSIFDYPAVLKHPAAEILASFRDHQSGVTTWFGVLAVSAALLAPAGILLGRLAGGSLGRMIAIVGVAAAVVQVVGLSRWVLLIPGVSADALDPATAAAAVQRFEGLHFWLGTIVGETIGYALTATFTVLVVRAVAAPIWVRILGYASAALIATGVLIPLEVGIASLSNFAGYVLWCLWLIVMAVVLWRAAAPALARTAAPAVAARG